MSISSLRVCVRRIFSILPGFALLICLTAPSCAQEAESKAKQPAAEKSEQEKPDPFALPAEGDAAVYVKFIAELNKQEPTGISTQKEYVEYMTKVSQLLLDAGTRGLEQKPDEKQTIALLEAKTIGIISLYQLGELEHPKDAITLLEGYYGDERETVASFAKSFMKRVQLTVLEALSEAERKSLVDEIVGAVEKTGATRFNFNQLVQLGRELETAAPKAEVVTFYQRISKLAAESKDENVAGLAEILEGVVRRHDLPGKEMELFGKTATGEDFKWKDYRGKVVLVDFWATWCGPCVQEIPNLKANYDKYHELGFEVVGVNLDENLFQLQGFVENQEIPWVNIVIPESENASGKEHPLAIRYGVMGIPSTFLIDREGKVIAVNVFGPELEVQLEKLMGKSKPE